MKRYLTCWAEYDGTRWEAVCLDFNIAVQGKDIQEVERRLMMAIKEYLRYVVKLPPEEQQAFFNRKAPLGLRLKVLGFMVATILFGSKGGDDNTRHEFTVPCSATA